MGSLVLHIKSPASKLYLAISLSLSNTYKYTHTPSHPYTLTHIHKHPHTLTHIHTHTYTFMSAKAPTKRLYRLD